MEFLRQVDKTGKGHTYPHCTYQQNSATCWQLCKHVYVCVRACLCAHARMCECVYAGRGADVRQQIFGW